MHNNYKNTKLKLLKTNAAIWFNKIRIFTEYLHKIVTLARFGIGSLMMVQMDRNM
jgi:hypothetical protein